MIGPVTGKLIPGNNAHKLLHSYGIFYRQTLIYSSRMDLDSTFQQPFYIPAGNLQPFFHG